MVKGVAHLAFCVSDMEASLKFYETFGIKKVFSILSDENEPWIEYLKINNNQFIELFYSKEPFEPLPMWKQRAYVHLCLAVDDIHAAAKAITDAGYTLVVEPKQGKDNNWQCWTCDPDGNAVEFMQMMPDALQMKSCEADSGDIG